MTQTEVKNSNPKLYDEIFKKGISKERNRILNWTCLRFLSRQELTKKINSNDQVSESDIEYNKLSEIYAKK